MIPCSIDMIQLIIGLFQSAIFSRLPYTVDFLHTIRKIWQSFSRHDHIIIVRFLNCPGKFICWEKSVIFINENYSLMYGVKNRFPVPARKYPAWSFAVQLNPAVLPRFILLLNHLHKSCLACGAVPSDDGYISANCKIIAHLCVGNRDPVAPLHVIHPYRTIIPAMGSS